MTPATEVPPPSQSDAVEIPRAIITPNGELGLRAELNRLRSQLSGEFVERLRQARDFGETGSNDDYLQIKEEEALVRFRIARLEGLLERARVIDANPGLEDAAAIGGTVEVEDLDSGTLHEYRLVGSFERAGSDSVSPTSPIGRAVLGRTAGEEVEVVLPSGRTRRLRVLAVRPSA